MSDRIMVDIETLGTDPGAAIVSIGAVQFTTDADPGDAIEAEFFESVALESCDAYGLDIDGSTVKWWLGQPAAAREQLHGGRDLSTALRSLRSFVDDADEIWANSPAFDCAILREAYRAVDQPTPWRYWQERDYRTLREVLPDWPAREQTGVEHDALDDARYQAECLVRALNTLDDGGDRS